MKFIDSLFAALTCMICSFLIMAQEMTFQNMLDKFDANCNMMIEKNELPCKMWHKVASRDSNDDGAIDRREYDGIIGWLTIGWAGKNFGINTPNLSTPSTCYRKPIYL